MAIEYRLTLAGKTPSAVVAEWAFPEPDDRPTGPGRLLTAALDKKYGFAVTVVASRNGYMAVETDAGLWEWEPESFVSVTFRLDSEADREFATGNVFLAVRRVLKAGDEDTTLILNGDILLFARLDGVLVKHRRDTWWTHHPEAEQLIPG
ncbi:SitI3 family protein [Actinoplanes sp. NPDC026619]|uniref:SitI3 family protein n=1 Tax=Actinoplanes sp. NPDC026619 TaxID=3155798 RepID=UPI00340F118C